MVQKMRFKFQCQQEKQVNTRLPFITSFSKSFWLISLGIMFASYMVLLQKCNEEIRYQSIGILCLAYAIILGTLYFTNCIVELIKGWTKHDSKK